MDIPSAETISPQWFTECLRAHNIHADVEGYQATQVGTGQIGKCIRYEFDYAQSGPDAPKSLIGKFPSDDPASQMTGVMLQNFLKEVCFYQQLQSHVQIRTPRCYFAEIVDAGPTFFVLMEDLAPAVQGDQLVGCNESVARAAIMELVGLHAPSWCDRSLLELSWLKPDEERASSGRDLYNSQLPGFLERYGPLLEKDERDIIAALGESERSPLYSGFPDVFSLIHIDYRLDNLLIDSGHTPPTVTVVDWQSISLGAPLNDVAYFLGAGLLADTRRSLEQDIVRAYFQALVEKGVSGFDWESCWQAYRRGSFAGFAVTVIASMLVQRTDRGDKMFHAMAQRHSRHALDLDAQEFLA